MILDACTENGSMMLDPYMDNMLAALFPQVSCSNYIIESWFSI